MSALNSQIASKVYCLLLQQSLLNSSLFAALIYIESLWEVNGRIVRCPKQNSISVNECCKAKYICRLPQFWYCVNFMLRAVKERSSTYPHLVGSISCIEMQVHGGGYAQSFNSLAYKLKNLFSPFFPTVLTGF